MVPPANDPPHAPDDLRVRRATDADAADLAAFQAAMAAETEGRTLAPEVVDAGIRAVLEEPTLGFYLVAERAGRVQGSLLVTPEWSDWRNGTFWWIQSVYVRPEARRAGVFRTLYRTVRAIAVARAGVVGIRLYVERENEAAQRTYVSLGMDETPYRLFEEDLTDLGE